MRPIAKALHRWLEDVETGTFKAPHRDKNGLIAARISAIWWHCMDQEYFIDEKIAPSRRNFNDSLSDSGAVVKGNCSRIINGALYSGMVLSDKFLLKQRYQRLYHYSILASQTESP